MGYFYFARHGQTVWNVENKICGATDIALTEKGHEQAKELGRKILDEGIHIDEIICSPLMRAARVPHWMRAFCAVPRAMKIALVSKFRHDVNFIKIFFIFSYKYSNVDIAALLIYLLQCSL